MTEFLRKKRGSKIPKFSQCVSRIFLGKTNSKENVKLDFTIFFVKLIMFYLIGVTLSLANKVEKGILLFEPLVLV